MTKEAILGIVRHALTFGGGFLVAKGLADAGTIDQGVAALITLLGFGWSIWDKAKTPAA